MTRADLLAYRKDVYSQNGEDGVLAELLGRLSIERGFCVEFGAWDGRHLSNTYRLIERDHWRGLYIEGDPAKFEDLLANPMVVAGHITPVNAYVGLEGNATLDHILTDRDVPREFDLLSIDIDSFDYDVWKSLTDFRPRVVVIEVTSAIPPTVARTLSNGRVERSFANMLRLGHDKGYTLVCHTGNMIFVAEELTGKLGSREALADPTSLFCDRWTRRRLLPGNPVAHSHALAGYETGVIMVCSYADSADVDLVAELGTAPIEAIDDDGRMTAVCGHYAGMPAAKAQGRVAEDLESAGLCVLRRPMANATREEGAHGRPGIS